ncbi:hypothetical protein [Foetidibacter luteolus]|uniref:hypothetical protein n=1 Tax=Foetidibacter luteolus TaxID=2608880 RepID=UPI00129A486A|nr:hypothetical protein [Foetidibacter luteolus]
MGNIFDGIQNTAFDIVTQTFGYPAFWTPSQQDAFSPEFTGEFGEYGLEPNGETQTAQILFKEPTEKFGLSDNDYEIDAYYMEYRKGTFLGLKSSVNAGSLETVTIETQDGPTDFFVKGIKAKYDGRTIIATLVTK